MILVGHVACKPAAFFNTRAIVLQNHASGAHELSQVQPQALNAPPAGFGGGTVLPASETPRRPRVIAALLETDDGRAAFDLLSREKLPFSYADGEAPRWFHVVEPRPEESIGLRFYLPSIRRGCIAEYGEVPRRVAAALSAVERAADDVAEIVPTQEGSLLIASNWFALHDRVRQTISRTRENREALLCFVAHTH